jgi:hypothetical protein
VAADRETQRLDVTIANDRQTPAGATDELPQPHGDSFVFQCYRSLQPASRSSCAPNRGNTTNGLRQCVAVSGF